MLRLNPSMTLDVWATWIYQCVILAQKKAWFGHRLVQLQCCQRTDFDFQSWRSSS